MFGRSHRGTMNAVLNNEKGVAAEVRPAIPLLYGFA
jgi:hypothetical protein